MQCILMHYWSRLCIVMHSLARVDKIKSLIIWKLDGKLASNSFQKRVPQVTIRATIYHTDTRTHTYLVLHSSDSWYYKSIIKIYLPSRLSFPFSLSIKETSSKATATLPEATILIPAPPEDWTRTNVFNVKNMFKKEDYNHEG